MQVENVNLKEDPPVDRLKLVYVTVILHGIGILMPWNMYINAKDYFVDYKLSKQYTGIESDYITNFISYLGIASKGPNLIFSWLNVFSHFGGSLSTRIVWGLLVEAVGFVFTIILAMCNSSQWPGVFFWVTMASIVIINIAGGIYQSSIFGITAKLPFKYTGAAIIGNNVCGTFTSLISIASLAIAPEEKTVALYCFSVALFFIIFCLITYLVLPLNRFYRHWEMQYEEKSFSNDQPKCVKDIPVPYARVFRQCFSQCFNVFFVFTVTLSIFPAVLSDIKRVDGNFFIHEKYYSQIACFLTFNLFSCIGSWLSVFGCWPGPRWVVVPVVTRILFIPLFLICNYQPHFHAEEVRLFPVLLKNDWVFCALNVLLGTTNGYLSSVCMMYCQSVVDPKYSSTAGMFGAASMMTGLFCGVTASSVMPWLVANDI